MGAEARLLMENRASARGGRELVLIEPLAPAWKLYAVDALGPFGDEVKLAAEVPLKEPSWEALAEARSRVDALGAERYRRWTANRERSPAFDGAFAFILLGPPQGRFRLRIEPDGAVTEVENRLTDRWFPGDFGTHLEAWSRALREGREPPRGYWFWNHDEREPFTWEPHVYHALAVAMRLLETPIPLPVAGAPFEREVRYERFVESTRAVLETLTPKARLPFRGTGALTVRFTGRALDAGRWEILGQGRERRHDLALELERGAEWNATEKRFERDEVIARLIGEQGALQIQVGYRPWKES